MVMIWNGIAATPTRLDVIAPGGPPAYFQREVEIDNTGGGALTDYQVKVTVDYSANMRRDFNDIRFYSDSGGSSALDHWREYYIEGEVAVFWVLVASVGAASTETIYMRYGQGETATASDDSATMIVGADFDDGATTGWTINTAGSGAASVPTITSDQLLGIRVASPKKYTTNPVIALGAGGTWDDASLRDMAIVIDEDGYPVEESDGLWAYYGGYDGSVWKIGLAKSTDHGYTWTKYGSNPLISPSGVGGSWYETHIHQPAVIKTSGGTRYMLAAGIDSGGNYEIGVFSSADGLAWSDQGSILTTADFSWTGGGSVDVVGVPSLIKKSDGDFLAVFEARKTGTSSNEWAIVGATASTITGTWTPLNSGEPIFTSTGTGWQQNGVANAHIIEPTAGSYLIIYNGIGASAVWQLGFASSSDLSSWSRYSGNPVITPGTSGAWDDTHIECSFLVKENSTYLRVYYQGFADTNTAQIGLAQIRQTRALYGTGAANTDGWLIGYDLNTPSTGFSLECISENDPTLTGGSTSEAYLALYNSAAVITPDTVATLNALEMVSIRRDKAAGGDKYTIFYIDTGGTFHYWNGSSWATGTATTFGGPGFHKLVLWDDGTNYKMDIRNLAGTSILANVASIAKSSVRSPASGVVAVMGEVFTNAYFTRLWIDNLIIRNYASPEPTTTVGAES